MDSNSIRVYGALSAPKKPLDSGYDIAIDKPFVIPAGRRRLIMTSVQVELPEGACALVVPRSSMNKAGIFSQIGLIDSGYRGQIGVVLYNSNDHMVTINAGDRIAQLLIVPVLLPALTFVDSPDQLSQTERDESGFGSTGT